MTNPTTKSTPATPAQRAPVSSSLQQKNAKLMIPAMAIKIAMMAKSAFWIARNPWTRSPQRTGMANQPTAIIAAMINSALSTKAQFRSDRNSKGRRR